LQTNHLLHKQRSNPCCQLQHGRSLRSLCIRQCQGINLLI
jgi:hypothetical protein